MEQTKTAKTVFGVFYRNFSCFAAKSAKQLATYDLLQRLRPCCDHKPNIASSDLISSDLISSCAAIGRRQRRAPGSCTAVN